MQHTDNLEVLLQESLLRHDFRTLPHILLALLANEARHSLSILASCNVQPAMVQLQRGGQHARASAHICNHEPGTA